MQIMRSKTVKLASSILVATSIFLSTGSAFATTPDSGSEQITQPNNKPTYQQQTNAQEQNKPTLNIDNPNNINPNNNKSKHIYNQKQTN